MEQEREMTGSKSNPEYTGKGYERNGQEGTAPQPEFVRQGEFLTDKNAMEKTVNEELAKITDEQLLPYKMYLRDSGKNLSLSLGALIFCIGAMIFVMKTHSAIPDFLAVLIALFSSFGIIGFIALLVYLGFTDYFSIHPLYKLYRAKKTIQEITDALRFNAMTGKVEVKNLKQAFDLEIQNLNRKKEQEEEDRRKKFIKMEEVSKAKAAMIEQAKNSKL